MLEFFFRFVPFLQNSFYPVSYTHLDVYKRQNYLFDPHVYLKRFFGDGSQGDYVFLIDEAHNLLERGREMYLSLIHIYYLGKGGLLPDLTAPLSVQDMAAWLLEAFCIVAVNVYMICLLYTSSVSCTGGSRLRQRTATDPQAGKGRARRERHRRAACRGCGSPCGLR